MSVFRPSNGTWYSVGSGSGFTLTQFGVATDVPVAGDYDGDGKSDIAVFRPSNGNWYLVTSAGFTVINFGIGGDIPVASRR